MGLGLTVGFYVDPDEIDDPFCREQLDVINRLLGAEGLPLHVEPILEEVLDFDMFGYSGLHYLRRLGAYLWKSGKLPEPGDENAADDPVISDYEDLIGVDYVHDGTRFDHLLWHSDCEGFYVPIEFSDVLFCDAEEHGKLAGDMLGSSFTLKKECEVIARALELPLDEIDVEDDELWEAASAQGDGVGWKRYGIESFTCKQLHEACVQSIKYKALLVFA